MQEIDARRVIADVLTVSDPAAAGAMIKRDLFVPFRPKNFDKIPAEVKMVARTDKGLELPKNWTDLLDPKYKGKMVMPDPSYTAIQLMIVGTMSKKYGCEFYQKLRANDVMIVQGHQQVSETLTRGERLLAAEGADQYVWSDRDLRADGGDQGRAVRGGHR